MSMVGVALRLIKLFGTFVVFALLGVAIGFAAGAGVEAYEAARWLFGG